MEEKSEKYYRFKTIPTLHQTKTFLYESNFLKNMVKRIGTSRRKTRHKFRKNIAKKGKISITRYFQKFEKGDQVILKAEPSVHKGLYFPRFHGKVGIIKNSRGTCYELMIKDFKKEKTLLVHPVHLKKV